MALTQEQIEALPSRYIHKKSHLPYEMAKFAVNSLAPQVTSANKYRKWIKATKSYYMPIHPERIYPDFSWCEFLGVDHIKSMIEVVAEKRAIGGEKGYRPMWDAIRWGQQYCREHGITRRVDWLEQYRKDDSIPVDIPMHPDRSYHNQGYPGFRVWCGKTAAGVVEAVKRVEPILTLVHPINVASNIVVLVRWPDGIGEVREKWSKQVQYDRIIGCWKLESELMDDVNRIMEENGHLNGELYTIPNINQLKWELNSILLMVAL